MKDGIKTTEFYLTLLAQIVGIVVLFGVISAGEAQTIIEAVEAAVKAVVGLVVAIAPLIIYIKERSALKIAPQ